MFVAKVNNQLLYLRIFHWLLFYSLRQRFQRDALENENVPSVIYEWFRIHLDPRFPGSMIWDVENETLLLKT